MTGFFSKSWDMLHRSTDVTAKTASELRQERKKKKNREAGAEN